jgi:PTS system nitrogen regulatory IIA component
MRFMSPELIQVPLDARTKRSVLECLVETASRTWKVWEPATVLKALIERESLMSTAFDSGVAIPHPRQPLVDTLEESVVAFGRTFSPISFGAPNNAGTDLFFLVLCRDAKTHLQVLARIGRLIQSPNALERLRSSENNSEAFATLQALEAAIDAA